MEQSEYFTPSKEDIHLGYECEFHGMTVGGLYMMDLDNPEGGEMVQEPHIKVWEKARCGGGWDEMRLDTMIVALQEGQIRTPYITKEQVRNEGWIVKLSHPSPAQTLGSQPQHKWSFEKGNYAGLALKDGRIEIIMKDVLLDERTESTSNGRLYLGECKDINTFRKIMKLLNIS